MLPGLAKPNAHWGRGVGGTAAARTDSKPSVWSSRRNWLTRKRWQLKRLAWGNGEQALLNQGHKTPLINRSGQAFSSCSCRRFRTSEVIRPHLLFLVVKGLFTDANLAVTAAAWAPFSACYRAKAISIYPSPATVSSRKSSLVYWFTLTKFSLHKWCSFRGTDQWRGCH
jgi:hypothetical protein